MDTTNAIQIAVARADMIVCSVLRWIVVIVPLTFVMLLAILTVRRFVDTYRQNYYMPGLDITSEGPEDGDPWCEIGGEKDADPNSHL